MSVKVWRRYCLGILLSFSSLHLVWAQPSMNAELLSPTSDNGPYLNTYSPRLLDPMKWTVGATLDYARRPIELIGPSGGRISGIVDDLVMMHVTGAFGITDWVQVGLEAPLALLDRTINTMSGTSSVHTRLGDLKLTGKFRILDAERFHWGLAAVPYV